MQKLVYLMFIIIIFSGLSLAEVTDSCGTRIPEGIDLVLFNPFFILGTYSFYFSNQNLLSYNCLQMNLKGIK